MDLYPAFPELFPDIIGKNNIGAAAFRINAYARGKTVYLLVF